MARTLKDLIRELDDGRCVCELCGAQGDAHAVASHIANFHPGPLREAGAEAEKLMAELDAAKPKAETPEAGEPKAETPEAGEPEDFDVSDHNVDEVLAWVGDDRERAQTALDAEVEGKARVSLVEALEAIVGG